MNLLVGDQANFLYYSREKLLAGTELFKNYVDHLFELKQKNIPRSKSILNILWGALSQKAYNKKTINNNDDNCELDAIKPFNDDNTHIEVFNNDHQYKMGFARICPFLIAKGRSIVSKLMDKYIDNVVRCHTDGFIANKSINFNYGCNLGDIRYEGFNKRYYKINNSYNRDFFI